jgi:xanthine dehydrogenase molybdopterin-binding subunit B
VLLLRTDILHDAGDPVNPGIDLGQVQGGFLQGVGWVTTEEIKWDTAGRLLTHSPDTYKIPTANDLPADFRVEFLTGVPNPAVIGRSRRRNLLMLALSVWLRLRMRYRSGPCVRAGVFFLPRAIILLSVEELKKRPAPASKAN